MLSGSTGTPAARISRLASIFEPIAAIAPAAGPIHTSPASMHRLGEGGVLGEEPVAGVDRVAAACQRGVDRAGRRAGRSRPVRCPGSGHAVSASRTKGASASASENTATVPMPSGGRCG